MTTARIVMSIVEENGPNKHTLGVDLHRLRSLATERAQRHLRAFGIYLKRTSVICTLSFFVVPKPPRLPQFGTLGANTHVHSTSTSISCTGKYAVRNRGIVYAMFKLQC